MKKHVISLLLPLALVPLLELYVFATTNASLKQGSQLFNSVAIGSNGKSCGGCHNGGKGLEGVLNYDDVELAGIINHCIKNALQGKELDLSSPEMKSLIIYIRSIGHGQVVK
jgi:hypothetical protein